MCLYYRNFESKSCYISLDRGPIIRLILWCHILRVSICVQYLRLICSCVLETSQDESRQSLSRPSAVKEETRQIWDITPLTPSTLSFKLRHICTIGPERCLMAVWHQMMMMMIFYCVFVQFDHFPCVFPDFLQNTYTYISTDFIHNIDIFILWRHFYPKALKVHDLMTLSWCIRYRQQNSVLFNMFLMCKG